MASGLLTNGEQERWVGVFLSPSSSWVCICRVCTPSPAFTAKPSPRGPILSLDVCAFVSSKNEVSKASLRLLRVLSEGLSVETLE